MVALKPSVPTKEWWPVLFNGNHLHYCMILPNIIKIKCNSEENWKVWLIPGWDFTKWVYSKDKVDEDIGKSAMVHRSDEAWNLS